MNKPKLLVLDVDGVLSRDKFYDSSGQAIGKSFIDIDWTAIKSFKALGIPTVFLTGDPFNSAIAAERHITCYHSREPNGLMDKKAGLIEIMRDQGLDNKLDIIYVGDDLFDLPVLQEVGYPICPSNANLYVQKHCNVLTRKGGDGVVDELLTLFVDRGYFEYPDIEDVLALDAEEYKND